MSFWKLLKCFYSYSKPTSALSWKSFLKKSSSNLFLSCRRSPLLALMQMSSSKRRMVARHCSRMSVKLSTRWEKSSNFGMNTFCSLSMCSMAVNSFTRSSRARYYVCCTKIESRSCLSFSSFKRRCSISLTLLLESDTLSRVESVLSPCIFTYFSNLSSMRRYRLKVSSILSVWLAICPNM